MQLPRFFKRPAHTLLYITEAKTFRIDCDRKGIISGEISVLDISCETANALPGCLDSVFKQSTGFGKKVWILYSRLNTYALSLPSVQVQGVEPHILEQALQFEYEGLTGNSIQNSHLAYYFIGSADEMSTYWVNLLAKETLVKIKEMLLKHRCKFAGLSHPGGLPFLISGTESPSWLRIECWPNCIFTLAKTPETGLSLQIIHTEQNPQWQDEVNHWVLETGSVDKSEAIMNNKIEYIPNTDENYRLTLDGSLVFWLGLWAQHLIADDSLAVPLVNPQKTINKEILYMISSGGVALLLCSAHFSWNMYLRNDFQMQTEALSKTDKTIQNLRKSLIANQDKATKLEQSASKIVGNINLIPAAIKAIQNRPKALLETIAKNSPEDLIIESIRSTNTGLSFSGVSLKPELVNQLASAIEEDMIVLGWKLLTPEKQNMELLANGGPWQFTVVVEDMGLNGFINTQTVTP